MAGPYPLATLSAVIDGNGISAPSYADIFASLQASYRLIYGADIYIEDDSQDGQMLAIFAKAINDCNSVAIATYNAYSPASAQGAGLASVVKINGLQKEQGSNSTCDVIVTCTPGTQLINCLVGDSVGLNTQWALPPEVDIDDSGEATVTVTCTTPGIITAGAGTLTKILTPTLGWQTVNNVAAATPGAAVEQDAVLRARQAKSTALPAQTVLKGIEGGVADLAGVQLCKAYENDTGTTDANTLPPHSISIVVEGGDAVEIATTIAIKKTPGTGTYGTTTEVIIDQQGVPNTINFYRPTAKRVVVALTINALAGYVSTTGVTLVAALAAYVSAFNIGDDLLYNRLIAATNIGLPLFNTFEVTAMTIGVFGGSLSTSDIIQAFNERATLSTADITLTTT